MSSSRRQYPFHLIEPKWQNIWDEQQAFRAFGPGDDIPPGHPFALRHKVSGKVSAAQLPPKFYILDMFPYPSGAGLHVGHPEGYTATDILARYKRARGFNVLHPMGWDAFGLPAEQYAVKTRRHPRKTTEKNIATFKRQIKSLGFSYDWSREIATTDPDYFKWTQWIFLKLYNSYFDKDKNSARPISELIANRKSQFPSEPEASLRAFIDFERLAFVSEAPVWWCEGLGTVLANEEVVDGKSEVGDFPVVRKPMRQWMLRITAYAEKLLQDLDTIDWTDSLKEMQRNWIGRSEGAEVDFQITGSSEKIRVFTTRPDTLFGATYMVLAPEHKLLESIVPEDWPDGTQFHWMGNQDGSGWKGLPAPLPTPTPLTREQAEQRAKELGLEAVSLANWKPEKELTSAVPRHYARHYRIVPLEVSPDAITLATDAPGNLTTFDAIGFLLRKEVHIKVAPTDDLEWAHRMIPGPDVTGLVCGEITEFRGDSPREAVEKYQKYVSGKSDLERTELAREKTGVFTGAYAINPVNQQKIPIWIADYVLASYGTGAIMAVPAHDTRDFEFAQKFNLPIVQVVQPLDAKTDWRGFVGDGISVNSTGPEVSLSELPTADAKKKIIAWLESKGLGKRTINYKLRDWLFSRQRYWGEPFPIIWKRDAAGNQYHEALPESALPVLPPELTDYKPTATGEPPLARAKDWVNLPDGSQRETNTMPQWAGSCWYYLRYLNARRDESFCGTLEEHYWMGAPTSGLLLSESQWKARLSDLLAAAREPGRGKRYITYAVVGGDEAARLKESTGLDLLSHRRFIDDQAIAHILNEHGDLKVEAARGQLAVTAEDIALIPSVVTDPDSVRHAGKTRRHLDAVLYEKRINGFLCCVEEVREGFGLLAVKTLYKRRATGAHAAAGLDQTSETFRRSNTNRAENAAQVKLTSGVDLYVGGTEHAVLHLLYARFWHKVLYDLGYVSTLEPFFKLVNQGMVLGEDNQKMSKSRGNVIPVDVPVRENGTDALRLYEMFMGPLEMVKPWSTRGVEGVYRFLGRVWRLFVDEQSETEFEQAETTADPAKHSELLKLIRLDPAIKEVPATAAQLKALHACIKKVTEDLDGLRFNTAISELMVFVKEAMTWETKPAAVLRDFLILLQPFAPHLAEELWEKLSAVSQQPLGNLPYSKWPDFDPALLVENEIEIPVQINGKLRDVIKVPADADNAAIEKAALASEKIKQLLEGKTIKKVIVVPKKLVNIVVA